MWLLVLSVLGALFISAFCSLMEATLLSLRPSQVAELSAKRPHISEIWQHLIGDIERPIAAILILNTTAHTIGASVAGAEFDRLYGEKWILLFSIVFTFLMLQFTEILPKGLGVHHNRTVAVWIAYPLQILVRLMSPVQAFVNFINRPFRSRTLPSQRPTAADEIMALTRFARLRGEISTEQEYIIGRGTLFSRLKVRDAMRPRIEIDAFDVSIPPDEVVGAMAVAGFSRIPVYEGDLDDVIGFVYIKDLLLELHMQRPIELQRMLRPALFVPPGLQLDRLVETFRRQRTQMAIVVDEYGSTVGIITLEDILEKLVGTIHDEHRGDDEEITQQDEHHWLVSGAASLDDVLEVADRRDLLSVIPRRVSRVGGLVHALLNRVAVPGDRTQWHGITFEVVETNGPQIIRVLVSTSPIRLTDPRIE